jgi:senataxin
MCARTGIGEGCISGYVSLPTCLLGSSQLASLRSDSYLAAFAKESLEEFFVAFEKWELEEVLKEIDPISSVCGAYLNQSQKSDTILYRMLSNWTLFCNAQVLAYLESHIPAELPNSWANLPLPPGILVLLVARNTELRTWASNYASRTQLLEPKLFTGSYLKALGVIHSVLQPPQSENSRPSLNSSTTARSEVPPLEYAKASEFWPGFNIILRLIPPNYLSNSPRPLVLRQDIFSHLRDNDSRS